MIIINDKNQKIALKRFHFKATPQNLNSYKFLLNQINNLEKIYPELKWYKKEDLHLTILYIGYFDELIDLIKTENKKITILDIKYHFQKFYKLKSYFKNFSLYTDELEVLRPDKNSVLILKMKPTDEILEFRTKLIKEFKIFLIKCGIKNPNQFISNNKTLKYSFSDKYLAHITLARGRKLNNFDKIFLPLKKLEFGNITSVQNDLLPFIE